MKVLWLAPIPLINDTDSHPAPWVMTLAKQLTGNGIELTILNHSSVLESEIVKREYRGIKLIYVKTPKLKLDILTLYQLRITKMRHFLASIIHEYDLLHIHGTEHQYEAIAFRFDIPKVISIQGVITEYIKILPKLDNIKIYIEWQLSALYEKIYLPHYSVFSCRTHWDSGFVKKISPKSKIYMIWEMIRPQFFEDHYALDSKKILFMGGRNPIKGLKELLGAYDRSLQSKGLKLIILGNCREDDIKNIIAKYKYFKIKMNNIECRGMQDAEGMLRAYDETFCLVHPTYIDNSPNSICEAQLGGLPVIATDVGGVSSLIKDRETGLLINLDIHEIEKAVEELYSNDALRSALSAQAKNIARKRHDPADILEQTLTMYHEIVKMST